MILNSLALKANGIDRATKPRVDGVEIVHDDAGEPTGLIIERNYTRMAEPDLLPAVPRFSSRGPYRRAAPLDADVSREGHDQRL